MERKDRAPLSPAAERKRKSRARQTGEKKEEVKAKETTTRKEARRKRTAEEKDEDNQKRQTARSARPPEKREEDNHKRQTARGTRSSKAKEEEKKERRNEWAGRSPQKKEEHNAKRTKVREERTPEQVETENADAKESMRGLRQARKAITLDRAGNFDTTMLWDVPGRDFLFDNFQHSPELSVKLWYANNGSWRDREPQMLTACLRLLDKHCSTIDDNGGDADDADASKQKLLGLNALCRESIEDKVSLLRVVHEHIKEKDWKSIKEWQQKERINDSELAALEWLVTKGLDCGDDWKQLREKRKPAPILDSWARSLIGVQLKVPGYWWKNWPSRYARRKYDCEVVDVDYEGREAEEEEEDDKRYFVIRDDDGECYPMEYDQVKEYASGVEQSQFYDLSPLSVEEKPIPTDEKFEKLCTDTMKVLEANSHENVTSNYREFIIKRMDQIVDSQLITPEKQRELGQKFLKAQGRGVSWGEEEDFTSVDAPLLTCASCGFRVENNGRDRDLKSLCWAELDDTQRSKHLERMDKPPLRLPINDKGGEDDFKKFETWKAYSRWPAKKPDELTKDTTLPDWMFCKNDNGCLSLASGSKMEVFLYVGIK